MRAEAITAVIEPAGNAAANYLRDVPAWIRAADHAVVVLLNVALVIEIVLVFAGTMVRTFFHSSALMGIDELSPLFLVTLAFMGGAVAYSRGQFIAITILVDRAPVAWQEVFRAMSEWVVIVVSLLIGGYSIPLLLANIEEKTILLGIGYVWMTIPITLGSLMLVVRAGHSLLQRSWRAIAVATVIVGAALVLFAAFQPMLAAHPRALYWLLGILFCVLVATGTAVGFALATVGIVCVEAIASANMMAVVMNAQRGSGGFIFLALPFFVLAGFIMDRADVGGRIVEFIGSLIGHVRGGLLQVMIVGVYISSCISGSKAADMATVGLPMNRKLEEHGYEAGERAALLAASAAMAESVPPSIALILVGSSTSISTGALFLAGVIPAAVIGLLLMSMVRFRAIYADWKPMPRATAPQIVRAGKRAILPLLIPVILLGGLVSGIATPTEVSTFAVIYCLCLGIGFRRITLRNFWQCLTSATELNGMIFYTVSAATIFSWAMTLEGVTTAIAASFASLGVIAFLPAVILITMAMGLVLESFVTLVILAPLLLPVAHQLHVDPLQYGIVMTEAFAIGCILPPVGIALYVACAITGGRVEKASKALLWYLPVMIGGLVLVAYVPTITTLLPKLLDFKY